MTMIEAVKAKIREGLDRYGLLDGVATERRDDFVAEFARAAIEAMREPTENMVERLCNHTATDWPPTTDEEGLEEAKRIWQFVVDSALED